MYGKLNHDVIMGIIGDEKIAERKWGDLKAYFAG